MDNKVKRIHAFTDDCLARYDAVSISKLLRNKEISIDEVVRASIHRAQLVNPLINAIASESFKLDLKQRFTIKSKLFSGVPTYIKDNLDLACYPTQHGSNAFKSERLCCIKIRKIKGSVALRILSRKTELTICIS